MTVNGLNVDTARIGQGMYEIICEKGDEAIVAFGMIPKWAIDMAEVAIREKVIELAAKRIQCTPEELKPHIDERLMKDTLQPILHHITLGIYDAASKAGKLVV